MKYQKFFLLTLVLLLASCGPKTVELGSAPPEEAAVAEVIGNHYNNEIDFQTLQGRLNIDYQTAERDQKIGVSFRMKKDDTIWMSGQLLGFPLAKLMMTPNSVQFYEKITGTYFDGDFSLLSGLLGTPLDFQKVQNLLIGQTIYDLRKERYQLTESSQGYQLEATNSAFLEKLFLLDPKTYKATAQQLGQQSANRNVTVTYPEYQQVEGRLFPSEINILANEGAENTRIDIEVSSLEFNVPVSFPFSIPSGYDEIVLE